LEKVLAAILLVLFLVSCSLRDKDSFVPAYMIIDEVDLLTNADQGFPSHNITDIWVTVDEEFLGVYPLPAKIPIIPSGTDMSIRVNAGVKPNGTINQSFIYPFYRAVELSRSLEPEEEFIYKPAFVYREDTKFDILEGFENTNVFINDLDGNFETFMVRYNQDNNGGNYSGLIELAADRRIAEISTNTKFLAENNAGGSTYLEFDYKTDVNIFVGYIVETTSQGLANDYLVTFVPNEEWNRVYIDFTSLFTRNDVENYCVTFFMEHQGSGSSQILFDNIKLVHF
jgi:hypothetical protein